MVLIHPPPYASPFGSIMPTRSTSSCMLSSSRTGYWLFVGDIVSFHFFLVVPMYAPNSPLAWFHLLVKTAINISYPSHRLPLMPYPHARHHIISPCASNTQPPLLHNPFVPDPHPHPRLPGHTRVPQWLLPIAPRIRIPLHAQTLPAAPHNLAPAV